MVEKMRTGSPKFHGDRVIIVVDGNCRIGSHEGPLDTIVGPALDQSSGHNYVSDAFVGFCRKLGLMAPATFPGFDGASREAGSLYSSLGKVLRCDYILVEDDHGEEAVAV